VGRGDCAVIGISAHELPERLTVWRRVSVEDPYGGSSSQRQQVGTVPAKVSQPAAAEQLEAQQAGSTMTMIVHMMPDVDVRRGDELVREDGELLRVKYTMHPSQRNAYLRADCELVQSEGDVT
jgi:SPP1 family predicted phage head-tail adaptor